jgi:poly(A) polymerase
MSLRPDGMLFDYHGGQADVLAGRVRFVGNAADRIQEDYLRILRLFRFQARYGLEDIDAATLKAVRDHAGGLAKLSAERIAQELAKLFGAPNPAPTVALMAATSVLADVLPEALPGPHLAQLIAHEAETLMPHDWLRRLAVLLPPEGADAVARRLKLSNADAARLKLLTAIHPILTARIAHIDLDRALYRLGPSDVTDRLLIAWSRDGAVNDDRWRAQLTRAALWQDKTLPISGADVLALGLTPGLQIGELLRAVEEWWIESSFTPGRDEALAHLKMLAEK